MHGVSYLSLNSRCMWYGLEISNPVQRNILNFNVGATVDLDVPRSFWSRLAGKYGNIFYWREKGEDASIESAVMAISSCLREPVGPNNCSEVK
ncbi:hypothetical protein P8452_02280 [Trifolium repens]|nr:hypothetical protein P8452_02276 [Trifolium repens]WJX11698.1 hypothetical protein P8452_02280 [Trifolium repens]